MINHEFKRASLNKEPLRIHRLWNIFPSTFSDYHHHPHYVIMIHATSSSLEKKIYSKNIRTISVYVNGLTIRQTDQLLAMRVLRHHQNILSILPIVVLILHDQPIGAFQRAVLLCDVHAHLWWWRCISESLDFEQLSDFTLDSLASNPGEYSRSVFDLSRT